VGGIAGALIGLGIPELEAKNYDGKVRGGNLLVAVHTTSSDQEKLAKHTFERFRARGASVIGSVRNGVGTRS
jgi:hypothetical protein